MVGLVIVSHSQKLAEGVLELAGQMTRGSVVMEAAGGIDDPDNPIGTDPMKVMAAIESVAAQAEDGVLVIMDLGSALMSAETALDFLEDDIKAKVRLCSAPIVEGTMAAAVQASVGASLEDVSAEAGAALNVKIQQLAPITGEKRTAGGKGLRMKSLRAKRWNFHCRFATDSDCMRVRPPIWLPLRVDSRPVFSSARAIMLFQPRASTRWLCWR